MTALIRFSLLALLAAAPAQAAEGVCRFAPPSAMGRASNVLDRLVGLTNDQRGIGGTGLTAQREERGLGGTGIIGVVTGFGSICVNGYEVELAQSTPVSVAGLPARSGDLRLGQVVELEAYPGAGGLQAAKVNVTVAVAGPVSAIATDRASLTVAGQTVVVSGFGGSAGAGGLRDGDWVVVSGLRRPDDSIEGTSILKLPRRGRQVFLSGVTHAAPAGVEIGSLVIAAGTVNAGQEIAVRGTLSGATLQAQTVEVAAATPFSRPMANLSVQGYGARVGSELQRLGVTAPALPAAGPPVQVDGAVTNGAFTATRVAPPPPPVDGAAPILRPSTITREPAASAPVNTPTNIPANTPGNLPPTLPAGLPAPPPRPNTPDAPVRPDRPAPPDRPDRAPPPVRPDRPAPPPRPPG